MTESLQDLAAVEQLLAESDALHGWLARLDQAPVAAPDGVRDRVRRDYQQRLDQITAGLRAHGDVIAAKLADDRREHAELQGRATGAREALAEAELRFAVGEYDRERFEAERHRHASDLETFDLSVAAVAERIARLEEVQRLVQRAPRIPEPEPIDLPPDEPEPELHVISEVDDELIAIADLAPDADPDTVLAIFDEPDASDEEPREPPATVSPPDFGPLSFRPPAGAAPDTVRPPAPPTRARPFDTAAPLGIPAADVPPRFVRPGERIAPATVPPILESDASANELFSDEIVATGPAPEAAAAPVGRTLRCGECGAMNRPLEWYCEKCGAELAAV